LNHSTEFANQCLCFVFIGVCLLHEASRLSGTKLDIVSPPAAFNPATQGFNSSTTQIFKDLPKKRFQLKSNTHSSDVA
jgi:hypothetical protein